MAKPASRILVFDPYPVVREGVARLIEQDATLVLCGVAETASAAREAIARLLPDLLILDLAISRPDGLDFIREVKAAHPRLLILVLSGLSEEQFAFRAFHAGAQGYIPKSEPCSCLVHAVHAILEGGLWFSPKVTARIVRQGSIGSAPPKVCPLSDREMQVYRLIGAGLRTGLIAAELGLSTKTVETYRERLKCKLQVADSAELSRIAQKWLTEGCSLCVTGCEHGKPLPEQPGNDRPPDGAVS